MLASTFGLEVNQGRAFLVNYLHCRIQYWAVRLSCALVPDGDPFGFHVRVAILAPGEGIVQGLGKSIPCTSFYFFNPGSYTTDFHELTHIFSFSIQWDLLSFLE